MNLVQIQERLKDAPVQAIMQYANGANPMVPPYLALAELKRRESINQSAQAQQAAQQGQQPSVKDQVEQAAGLAALQQRMQQQGMQNLMQQARPQAIPENIPQPQRQPESEGIAGLPAGDFNFADGGIVAFQDGGFAESMAGALEAPSTVERRKPTEEEIARIIEELRRQGKKIDLSMIRDIREGNLPIPMPVTPPAQPIMSPQAQPAGIPPSQRMQGPLPAPGGIAGGLELPVPGRTTMERRMPEGAPEATTGKFMPGEITPQREPMTAAPQAGIAALPGADQANRIIAEQMQKQPTPESAYEAERKMAGLYGLTQPAGEDRMKRIQQMEADRQKMLEDRGMERLMRVMGGIAGRGLQGAGPAYLSALEGERASDVAFRKQMDELLSGVEEKRRAEQLAGMQRATGQMGEQEKLRIGAAEKIFDAETRLKIQELQAKAATGRLSAEEQYILAEMRKGRSYPEIVEQIAGAKGGPRAETLEQQRYKDTYLKVAKAYDEMLVKPEGISRDEYIRREVDRAMGVTPIGGSSAIPQQAIDYLKKNPNLAAQFDAKYGVGASAKYLGR